ncbi:MAG: hypothetical protein QOK31_2157 [Solirubrobacteraceae bacterium]|jgi:hypothetical protein|nr:hypothetical protein [Solirubrobacteraceae bacterium]
MQSHLAPDLERHLLRCGVGARVAERDRCRDCGRTPLIGEDVHVYQGERIVCALCRPLRREDPLRVDRVRSSQFGHAVRLTDQRAA